MPKTRSHCLKCCNHFFFSFRVWIFSVRWCALRSGWIIPGQQNGKIYEKKSLVQNIEIIIYACTSFQFHLFNKVCVLLSSANVDSFVCLFVCGAINFFFSFFAFAVFAPNFELLQMKCHGNLFGEGAHYDHHCANWHVRIGLLNGNILLLHFNDVNREKKKWTTTWIRCTGII